MAHGKPDWNRTNAASTTFQMDDLGELAARLGSVVTFDRRGDVVFIDDFENGLVQWLVSTGGTGAAAAVDTAQARNGAQSILMTGGSDGEGTVQLSRLGPLPVSSFVAAEASVQINSPISSFDWFIRRFGGGFRREFIVRYDDVNDELQTIDENGAFVSFATGVILRRAAHMFHTGKLVIDLTTNEYVRFIINNTTHLLTGRLPNAVVNATEDELDLVLDLTSRAGNNDTVRVDDAILTQNEP